MKSPESGLPRIFRYALRRLPVYEELFAVSFDLEVEYVDRRNTRGRIPAWIWLISNLFLLFLFSFFLSLKWSGVMVKNFLKIALRNLFKNKSYAFINLSGLAVGMAACLLMMMFVINEYSYDQYHLRKDGIYRLIADWGTEGSRMRFAGAMPAAAPALKNEVAGVETAGRIRPYFSSVVTGENNSSIKEENIYFSDPEILDIFTWKWISGNKQTALVPPFSVVLTEDAAQKYFGTDDPLGQSILINERAFQVTGLIANIPANSHLRPGMLVSYESITSLGEYPEQPWNVWGDDVVYFLLNPDADLSSVSRGINELYAKNTGPWMAKKMRLIPQSLSAIHWDNSSRGDSGPKGNRMYITIFLTASLLILLIACFNFMNLSTSRYTDRLKEVGVRKVVGANRGQLIGQFLTESLLLAFFAVLLGGFLFELLKIRFFTFLDVNLLTASFFPVVLLVISLVLVVGIIGGIYPALFLSGFQPHEILKSVRGSRISRLALRRILVVAQYSISIFLIIGALVIFSQIHFMKHSDLGFDKDNILLLRLPYGDETLKTQYPVLRDELMNTTGVLEVSGAYTVPGVNSQYQMSVSRPGGNGETSTIQVLPGDFGFVRTLGLELSAGRDFSPEFGLDSLENVILNETAVKDLSLDNPVGQKLSIPRNGEQVEVTVIGVVKDFFVKSLHTRIAPMMILIDPQMFGFLVIRVDPAREDIVAAVQETWKKILPSAEFNHRYLRDAYFQFYDSEEKIGKLVSLFTALAFLVSCLGLFGLASFAASKKTKEIGIRKILGATTSGITFLLSRQFTGWVLLANVFAWPAAYYFLDRWLKQFAYRISIGPVPFLIGGAIALLIALLTVSGQSIKTALSDPVDSLRYE